MSDNTSVSDRLIQVIADNTKLSSTQITPELNLENSGLDSFARVELVMAIEDHFNIEFSDSESANIVTISDITHLIDSKIGQA